MDGLGPIRSVSRTGRRTERTGSRLPFCACCLRVWLLAMALGFSQAGDLVAPGQASMVFLWRRRCDREAPEEGNRRMARPRACMSQPEKNILIICCVVFSN
ncbi:hypothetical protein V8C44DRAFT_317006 [Trichoderma aethiopicum]